MPIGVRGFNVTSQNIQHHTRRRWLFRKKKQSVKRGIWYIGGKRKRQRGGALPLAAFASPILGNIDGVI